MNQLNELIGADHRTQIHEKSLANLMPPWQPGQSGNPKGRPAAGAVLAEWLDVMCEWSRKELEAVVDDDDAPSAKVAAARTWLDARTRDRTAAGSPIAGPELDRISDRTVGKPHQSKTIETVSDKVPSLEAAVAALISLQVPEANWPPRVLAWAKEHSKQIATR